MAISSYLVADPGSIDGYDRIISGTLGTTLDTLRDMAQAANGFSVTNAVLNYGQQVGYQPVSLAETRHDLIAEFIRLSDRLVEIESIDADSFRIDIANDNPLPNKEFMAVRDAMRTLLREIPEVKDFWQLMVRRFAEGLNQLTESQKAEIVTYGKRSLARLQALHGELQVCVEGFRTSVPYAHILNYAASGIGAWMP